MNYLIYARVSPRGDTETETSIQMQIDFCKAYIQELHGRVEKVLFDEFYSGKNLNRPAFQELLADLESGKAKWDCICVYKLSRLSRSLRDGAAIFDKLFQFGKGFVSVTERNLDFSTPAGRAMLGILQVFNQFEREQTVENTRNKLVSIASKGLWPVGHPPFGYKRGERGDNKLYVDPVNSQIVRKIYETYTDPRFTTADVLREFPQYSKHKILEILRNQTYLGKICYNGKIYAGQHEPIIDQALFDAAQSCRSNCQKAVPRPKAQRYPYILGSLIRCDCGHYLTPASAKSGKYHYYQCTNPQCRKRFRAEKIESAVFDTIRKQPIPENVLDRVMEKIEKAGEEMNRKLSPELQRLPSAISTLEQRRDKITEALIESGAAAKNALTEKLAETEKQLTDIRARMEFLKSQILPSEEIATEARRMVQQIRTIQDAFQESEGPLIQRQAALMYVKAISYKGKNEFRIEFNYTQKEVRLKVLDGGAYELFNELFSVSFLVA